MNIKNLIIGGCSFSSSGIGGVPPTDDSRGGCSFIDDVDYTTEVPISWSGFLSKRLQVTSLINVAVGGYGNFSTTYSIMEILNRFNYDSNNTLVIMNLSDPMRLELPCSYNHHNATTWIPWDKSIIPYKYLHSEYKHLNKIKIDIGVDQIEQLTSNSIELLFNLLSHRKIDFYFLMMNNYRDHKYLGPVIEKFKNNLIVLDPGISMMEFCQLNNLTVSDTNLHPSVDGHRIIADIIYEHITQ